MNRTELITYGLTMWALGAGFATICAAAYFRKYIR